MTFQLRQNQSDALNWLWDYVHDQKNRTPRIRNPLLSAPVAFGKSITIAEFNRVTVETYPHMRILNLVHVKELVDQNYKKFKAVAPAIRSGVFMDSLGEKDHRSQVIYGSVHSVYSSIDKFQNPRSPINILVVDECHWIQKKDTGMYRAIIEGVREASPDLVVIGWTGTEWRMDGGPLAEGDDDTRLFDDVYYADTIRGMLDKGYHTPLVVPREAIMTARDTSSLKTNDSGDFNERSMAQIMDEDIQLIHDSVDEYRRLAQGRNKHLVFGTTIKHCRHLLESFSRYYRCEFIHGGMKKKDRKQAIQDYKNDKLDMLISGIILTTGFDEPRIDCIGLFRPVGSSALYIQIAGRGLRIHPEKANCLWLDFTSTTAMHGPVDEVKAPKYVEKGSGSAVVKLCGNCEAVVAASARVCPECNAEFEIVQSQAHEDKASTASILGAQEPITERLTGWRAIKHTTQNKQDAVKLEFSFGLASYTHIMNFNTRSRYFACKMWSKIVRDEYKNQCPESAANALMYLNEMNVWDLPEYLTFHYEEYYTDRNGKRKKLTRPRLTEIL